MKNCLVLGSGRSGTSMVGGTLASAGYFMGESMMPPSPGNPKGYFESFDIEAINEELIAPLIRPRPAGFMGRFFRGRPVRSQRWLGQVPVDTEIVAPADIVARIRALVARQPFCFKDPRFCYTLPAWRPYVGGAVFVCVFRHPSDTAQSILRECATEEYLQGFRMTFRKAIRVWNLMYGHILASHSSTGKWLFLHYDQVLTEPGLSRLESFVETEVDRNFPNHSLRRSVSHKAPGGAAFKTYLRLCELANHKE